MRLPIHIDDLHPRKFSIVVVLVFLTVALLLYAPVLGGRVPLPVERLLPFPAWGVGEFPVGAPETGDLVTQIYPWRVFAAESIRQGILPLWNSSVLMGTPFVANAQSAVFYPPHAAFYVLPVNVAWSLMFVLHFVMGGVFATLFFRSIGSDRTSSIVGGLIFSMCGFLTVWRGYPMGEAAVWLPLACWSVVRLRRRPTMVGMVFAGVSFAMPMLAGHPTTAFHIALVGVALAAVEFARPREDPDHPASGRVVFAGLFAGAGVLGVLLASIQLLPTIEWMAWGTTGLNWVWPDKPLGEALAFVSRDLSRHPNWNSVPIPEGAAYVGAVTLLLAPIAFFSSSRRYAWTMAGIGLVAFGEVFSIGPFSALLDRVPELAALKHWRLLLVIDFSLAALAALGLSAVRSGRARSRAIAGVTGAALGGALLATYRAWSATPDAPVTFVTSGAAVFLVIGAVVVVLGAARRIPPGWTAAAIVLLVMADMVPASDEYIRFALPESVFPPAGVFEFLEERTSSGTHRVASLDAWGANTEMMYGLRTVTGYDNTYARVFGLFSPFGPEDFSSIRIRTENLVGLEDRRLDLANVRFLVQSTFAEPGLDGLAPARFREVYSEPQLRVYENLRALPPAFLVPAEGVEIVSPPRQLLRLEDPRTDPEAQVLVDAPPAFAESARVATAEGETGVTRFDRGINRIRLDVVAGGPSILVLSEANYPGWNVSVNGEPAGLLHANYAMLGVGLDEGEHEVVFEFDPPVFRLGLGLSIAGVVLSLLFAGAGSRAFAIVFGRSSAGPWRRLAGAASMVTAGVLALVWLAAFAGGVGPPTFAPEMHVDPQRVVAGVDSYEIRFTGTAPGAVRIRYSLNEAAVEEFTVMPDAAGRVRLEVGAETERGGYRFVEFLPSGSDEWVDADATIEVE